MLSRDDVLEWEVANLKGDYDLATREGQIRGREYFEELYREWKAMYERLRIFALNTGRRHEWSPVEELYCHGPRTALNAWLFGKTNSEVEEDVGSTSDEDHYAGGWNPINIEELEAVLDQNDIGGLVRRLDARASVAGNYQAEAN